ncbi:uncharacterized protein G2W53_002776 [Senna tora]|uniref:Retrotransposon Copia-like N-terminal domain-containing protein n=1 Tax=Senna tora TaxID=362788 RepID=A0A834XBC7_9FABA|nr:uncharacterized protein G2W53_002776 [Senna tora]
MTTYSEAVSGGVSRTANGIGSRTASRAPAWSLSSSDQPGMVLVTSPLVGTNFVSWSLAIKTALEAKEKLGFIDGTIKEPEDESEHKRWKPVDSMVKAWVRNSIERNLAETFMFCRTSRELWMQIEERYGVKSGPKFYQLQQELASLKQGNDTVTIFYNKIHKYWDELHRLRPTPRCVCAKCTFNKAFGLVVNVETEKRINSSQGSDLIEGSAMLARGNNRSESFKKTEDRKSEKMAKYCDHCQQNGHTRDACFKLIGYPEWFKDLREQRKRNGKRASSANMVTETPIDLPKEKGAYDYANVMTALQELTKIVKEKNEEQHVNFVNLGEFAGKSGQNECTLLTDTTWVVDTGASSHMCFNKEILINLRSLEQPIPVHLSDGSVQNDQKTKHALVEGKLLDNLYILKHDIVSVCNVVKTDVSKNSVFDKDKKVQNCLLWHQRLGHAPIDVLKHIDG